MISVRSSVCSFCLVKLLGLVARVGFQGVSDERGRVSQT